jgi:hypothetical protein
MGEDGFNRRMTPLPQGDRGGVMVTNPPIPSRRRTTLPWVRTVLTAE